MLARHYLNEVLALIRTLGLPVITVLTFLYLVSIGSLSAIVTLSSSVTNLASTTEMDIFFKPEVGLDEVQFIANQISSNSLISEVTIRSSEHFLDSLANQISGSPEILKFIQDLSPSIHVKIKHAGSNEIQSVIRLLNESPYLDEIIYNMNGHDRLMALAHVLNRTSIGMLIIAIIISIIISVLITNLIVIRSSLEIQVLKSLGATPFFIALPMILFLLIIQPFSYLLSVTIYKAIAYHISHLISGVDWLESIIKTNDSLDLSHLWKFWILSLLIFLSFGGLKILRVSRYGHMVTLMLLFYFFGTPSWAMKEVSLTNLDFKKQAITNELFLIEKNLNNIQRRIEILNAENKNIQETIMGLAHYYRKSKIKLNHVWLSDSAQLSLINSSAKNAENLFTLIKLHMAQLKNNKDALLSYHKEFKKRQTRLEKLHMNLASALNLKKSEYDHFRNLVAQQIHELKTDFEQHGLNIISSKASTLYSPIFGSVVFTHYDQILGNVIIIEKSTHTHLIFFDLQHSNLKKGDRLKPGDIIAVNSTKIPKLQIRILNQTIPIHQVIAKGS